MLQPRKRKSSADRKAEIVDTAIRLAAEIGPDRVTTQHLADAVEGGGADAVLAAGIFHFGECTIREVKELFQRRGIPVRPPSG